MNDQTAQAQHVAAIAGAPAPQVIEPDIPQVSIPHMGTSQNSPVPQAASVAPAPVPAPAPAAPVQTVPAQAETVQLPPLPDGVSQQDIDAAIQHVEQTGKTDGIAPLVLAAACQQIEVKAKASGIDINQPAPDPSEAQAQAQAQTPAGPANYVEAAVMDKKGTFDNFYAQRDSLQSAVTEQREAAKSTYQDALNKSEDQSAEASANQASADAMKALATELNGMDPKIIALINAMGVISNTPEVMKSILWMEIINAIRDLISSEVKQQISTHMNNGATS